MSKDDDDNEEDFSTAFSRFMRIAGKQALKQLGEPQHGFSIDVSAVELRQRLVAHATVMRDSLVKIRALPTREEMLRNVQEDAAEMLGRGVQPPPFNGVLPEFRPEESQLVGVDLKIKFLIDYASFLTDASKVYRLHYHEWEHLFDLPLALIRGGPSYLGGGGGVVGGWA